MDEKKYDEDEREYAIFEKEVNEAYKPCGDCIGCSFEDSSNWSFEHLKGEKL